MKKLPAGSPLMGKDGHKMGSLQNLLNVYFHMKSHYDRLKHVKSRINTNLKPHSAGRAKKARPKPKDSNTHAKETRERPPTRRSHNETSRNVRSPKYQSFSHEKPGVICEQHEYLQFSLRITEEIIRNDLYKNDQMVHVLKNHYQASKGRLNSEKLLKTIAELCAELNIQLNDSLLLYLDNRGRCPSCNNENPLEQKVAVEKGVEVQIDNATSHDLISDTAPSNTHPQGDNDLQESQFIMQGDLLHTHRGLPFDIETIPAVTQFEDLGKPFEFDEVTLKASGEESLGDFETKEFHVLHDAAYKFHTLKESDLSILNQVCSTTDGSHISIPPLENQQQQQQADKVDIPKRVSKNLVIAHYSTSFEPVETEMKDLCIQTSNDDYLQPNMFSTNSLDAATQKNLSPTCPLSPIARPMEEKQFAFDCDAFIEKINMKCKNCNIDNAAEPAPLPVPPPIATSTFVNAADGQYVLLDGPVLVPKDHTKSMEVPGNRSTNYDFIEKSYQALKSQSFLANLNSKVLDKNRLHTNEIYDLTPQKDGIPEPVSKFTASSNCSCVGGDNLLLSNHYERYQKVNEKLSFFYPTIATQVSSMDLMCQPERPSREKRDDYKTKEQPSRQLSSKREWEPKLDISSTYAPKKVTSINGMNIKEHQHQVNLDNYAINPPPPQVQVHAGTKRHYEDFVTERDYSAPKSYEEISYKTDRSEFLERLQRQASTDSVERRIQTLRQDIEKYNTDDNSIRRRMSQPMSHNELSYDESRRDSIDVFKKPPNTVLPSDISLPKHRKMSVLRKPV